MDLRALEWTMARFYTPSIRMGLYLSDVSPGEPEP